MSVVEGRHGEVIEAPEPWDEHMHNMEIEKQVYLGKNANLVEVVEMNECGFNFSSCSVDGKTEAI